jgi:uncharacterized protein (DUF1684 family)
MKSDFSLPKEGEDPMDRRSEKLKAFREKKNQFFKEDPNSPLKENDRKKFKGLIYYPIDLKYAMIGTIEKYPVEPKPLYVTLPTNIYRPLGGGRLFLPFKDKTSDTETYPKGRYLYVESMSGGKVLIDFNRAYNPFCQFNEKYICPFAPEENWLPIGVRAGEKRFR